MIFTQTAPIIIFSAVILSTVFDIFCFDCCTLFRPNSELIIMAKTDGLSNEVAKLFFEKNPGVDLITVKLKYLLYFIAILI